MAKFAHFITRKLDNNLVHFKQSKRQTESVIFVRENFGELLSGIRHIQCTLLSLCGTFCFAGAQTYRYTSTQIHQSLNLTL
jgi:hypothetical protein